MKTIIELKNISYSTDNSQILRDISFKLQKASWTILTGPSGSGKSTVLKIMSRLISQTQGNILLEGNNINNIPVLQYRREVSYAAQDPQLFGRTVKDNLDFPFQIRNLEPDVKREYSVLNDFDLSNDFLEKKITDLSGGQKQRVALSRNLIFLPKILLLDEVTTGLDLETKNKVLKTLSDYNKSKDLTIFEITHDSDELSTHKRTIDLVNGKIKKEEIS